MEILKERLPSGLTVILSPMEGTKTITEVFMARAGWKYEWPEIQGLSHFIEHMTFKGTKKRPTTQDITKEVDGRGGVINAFTGEERTGYWVKMSARFSGAVHDLVSDMLLNSKFDPAEIDRERGTILEELNMYIDDPMGLAAEILWPELLHGNQPAGQCGLGTRKTIRSLKREDFLDYMKKLYVASNAVLCVAGHIEEPKQTIEDIASYFQKISQARPAIQKPLVVERQRKPKILLKDKKTAQTNVVLGVRGYSLSHPNKYALQILSVILGGNMSSRLFKEVRERRGLAYNIQSIADFQTDVGCFAALAGLNQEKITEALKVILEEYRRVKEEKVSEEELQMAKDFLIGRQEIAIEDSRVVAVNLAEQFTLTGKVEDLEEKNKKVKAVTSDDIQKVAQDIFRNEKLNLAMVGPHKKDKDEFYKLLRI